MSDLRRWLPIAVRLIVGGVFIYAGVMKLQDPLRFADSIASFEILPNAFVSPMALGLPLFEIVCGALIILPPGRTVGSLAIVILSAMFFGALLSTVARGLTINCGCFGSSGIIPGAGSGPEMVLDALLFFGALYVRLHYRPAAAESIAAAGKSA